MTPVTQGTPPDAQLLSKLFVEFSQVIGKLRAPEGCPWDREQTMKTIKPYTLEETYELLEAIDSDKNSEIQEELGDVLLQVVLHSQIAADEGRFNLLDVIQGITKKMIARHPHVFGDAQAKDAADVRKHWEQAKAIEKQDRQSIFDGIPTALPSLAKASRITAKAASVGYDFPHRDMLFDKLREEITELQVELYPDGHVPDMSADVDVAVTPDAAIADPAQKDKIESELGDVLFVVANIARRWGIQPEEALRRTNEKFARRFRFIETAVKASGKTLKETSLNEMEVHYQAGKALEKVQTASVVSNR